jgi:hypothetical protein
VVWKENGAASGPGIETALDVLRENVIGAALRRRAVEITSPRIGGEGVAIPLLDGIRRIGNDGVEGLIIPVLWIGKCITVGNIKVIVVDVVQKHIDTAEVVSSRVYFLPKEPLPHVIFA